jgi:PAS domain-containing protein
MPSHMAYRPGRKMKHLDQRFLARYALPAVAVAAALLVNRLLGLSHEIPFTLFFAAVLLSAWYGGVGPALNAVVLSILAVYSFFVPSRPNPNMGENILLRSLRFVLVSGLLIWLTESRRRAEAALRDEIRQRSLADEALHAEKERLDSLTDSLPVMLYGLDAHGRVCLWNREIERVTGYSRKEILGKTRVLRPPLSRPPGPRAGLGGGHLWHLPGPGVYDYQRRWRHADVRLDEPLGAHPDPGPVGVGDRVRHHRPQAGRGGAAGQRGAIPRHVRERWGRHR